MYIEQEYPLGPLNPCASKQLEVIRTFYDKDKSSKKVHSKENRFDLKKQEHCGLLLKYIAKNKESLYRETLERNGKERTLNTPFRLDKNQESIVQFTSNITFNKVKGPGTNADDIRASWDEVIQHEILKFHKSMQYYSPKSAKELLKEGETLLFSGEYPHKQVKWSPALCDTLKAAFWPEINRPMADAIEELIKMNVVPSKNKSISIMDSAGVPLKSPLDGKALTAFEACVAFGKLCNIKFEKNGGDDALVLVGVNVRRDLKNSPTYYGTVKSVQPVLDANFMASVNRGEWWESSKFAGQATDPPKLTMPFNNFTQLMVDYTSIRGKEEEDPFGDKQRHSAFHDYTDTLHRNSTLPTHSQVIGGGSHEDMSTEPEDEDADQLSN